MLICASLHIDAGLSPASFTHSALCSIFLFPVVDEILLDFTKQENAFKISEISYFLYLPDNQANTFSGIFAP